MQNSEQMVAPAQIQAAFTAQLTAAAIRQVTDDKYWWDKLPVPKTLKLRLPRPRHVSEHIALEIWLSVLEQKAQVSIEAELV